MYKFSFIIFIIILSSCSKPVITSENKQAGKLQATHSLVITQEKNILLDDLTAPKSPYMQIYNDTLSKTEMLTFLNPYNNSIYIFNYENGSFIKKISYEKEGGNAILSIAGYYIKNMDSIYVYNRPLVELVLTNESGSVEKRIPLRGNESNWPLYYPQYAFNTSCPIIENDGHLILTGLCPFSIEKSLIDNFKFVATINLSDNQVEFHHTYPSVIYGNNANWEDALFMQVYPILSPAGDLVFSFTASHELYITAWNHNNYETIYGGSNIAESISSIDWDFLSNKTPKELVYNHYLQQDLYASILHDPWRNVYYRFMQKGIKNATTRTQTTEKSIIIIIMDESFNYLGEKLIGDGKEWNWSNSFVTKEGLNIEYINANDLEEDFMNFKIFSIEEV